MEEKNSAEDLSEFSDYLSEFDMVMVFDNEDCPICGVTIPEKPAISKSPYVEYKCLKSESEITNIQAFLNSKNISFKIEKRLDKTIIDQISYEYVVYIPFNSVQDLK